MRRRLLEREPAARVVTVDVSAGLLAAGHRADRRLLPVVADLAALPLSDVVIDGAVCVRVGLCGRPNPLLQNSHASCVRRGDRRAGLACSCRACFVRLPPRSASKWSTRTLSWARLAGSSPLSRRLA
jgi:hypothetical protein